MKAPDRPPRLLGCVAVLAACSIGSGWIGCTFELEAPVDPIGGAGAPDGAASDADAGVKDADAALKDADAALKDAVAALDVANDGKTPESGVADTCTMPPSDVVCGVAGLVCGSLTTVDSCGAVILIQSCGDCLATEECEQGACVPHSFAWKSSSWSACSAPCGGGTQTRDVWCERDDGKHVADALCAGGKPATSQGCNQSACCSPSCVAHDACGSDGCGGNCGTCATDRYCREGYCVWDHGNNGTQTCDTICAWGSSVCVDTSTDSCGVKADTKCYCW